MIIDIVKSKGIPFKCDNCNTYFAWKPEEQNSCRIRCEKRCEKGECRYYEPQDRKCPACGSKHITKVPAIVYKIIREIRR